MARQDYELAFSRSAAGVAGNARLRQDSGCGFAVAYGAVLSGMRCVEACILREAVAVRAAGAYVGKGMAVLRAPKHERQANKNNAAWQSFHRLVTGG